MDDAHSISHSSTEDADPAVATTATTAAAAAATTDTDAATPATTGPVSLRPPPGLERRAVDGSGFGSRPHTGWRLASLLGEPTASVSSAPATSTSAATATVVTAPPRTASIPAGFGLFGAKARGSSSSAPRNNGAAAPGHRPEAKEPLWGHRGPGAPPFAQGESATPRAANPGRPSASEASGATQAAAPAAGNAICTAPPAAHQQHQQHRHSADVERMLDQHTREVAASMFNSVLES